MANRTALREMGLILNLAEEDLVAKMTENEMRTTWAGFGYDTAQLPKISPIMVRFILKVIDENIGAVSIGPLHNGD